MIRRIAVVIPARDEADRIDACLHSVRVAAARVASTVEVDVVVVADGCVDDTAARARSHAGVVVIELEGGGVGAARAAGVTAALGAGADWIANTDADSTVPGDWLAVQLEFGEAGVDALVGTVRPDFSELTPEQRAVWEETHRDGRSIGHVHGANLGIRASAYLAAGGFTDAVEHEDTALVDRLERVGRVVATGRAEVVTSGRPVGRTPGGYARYLREDLLRAVVRNPGGT